jgi:hypothetical protein
MSDSTTTGYIPASALPVDGTTLEDVLQVMVVGVTGLSGDLVRPRWQPIPPAQPAATVDWCAIGVTQELPDTNAYVEHDPTGAGGLGVDIEQRHEDIEVLASFFGPNSQAYAKLLILGLRIAQNLETLSTAGLKFKRMGPARNIPDLISFQYIRHVDVELTFRRIVYSTFQVRTIVSAPVTSSSERITNTTTITP